jgi:glycosyltransferase involved in cell wall biosynthesis
MSKTARVSVVIPCFRCVKTIERALASVVAQTVRPAEVILVDDASGDGTRTLLNELRDRYEPGWIKLVLLDQNVGAGSARNAGWAMASQPLIAFLDADDAWHFRKIEIQYGFMESNPEVVLSGHGFRLLKQGVLPYWEVSKGTAKRISKWSMLLSNRFVTPSVMVRREVPYRFIDRQRYMEDHMLWLNVVCAGARVVKLPAALAAIYKDPFGVTGLSSRVWLMERSDLGNYKRLYRDHCITRIQFVTLVIYSLLKYSRRLIIYAAYLRWKR